MFQRSQVRNTHAQRVGTVNQSEALNAFFNSVRFIRTENANEPGNSWLCIMYALYLKCIHYLHITFGSLYAPHTVHTHTHTHTSTSTRASQSNHNEKRTCRRPTAKCTQTRNKLTAQHTRTRSIYNATSKCTARAHTYSRNMNEATQAGVRAVQVNLTNAFELRLKRYRFYSRNEHCVK